jgi:ferredoxin-NADP reductase
VLTLPIREVVPATPRARIVRLGLDDQPFAYTAGQALLIGTHAGDKRRPYSIAGAPEDARRARELELLVGVDADGEAGPHLTLEPGVEVDVEGPLGTFTFPEQPLEKHFIFIAGGTGIAPLRAMLRHVILGPIETHRVGLLYSARTPEEFAYEDEFQSLAASGAIEFRQTITRDSDRTWSGARGRIDRAALASLVHDAETLCFVCGPLAMVDEMPRLLGEIGIARAKIRIEEWGSGDRRGDV